jgi:hypothetical protein
MVAEGTWLGLYLKLWNRSLLVLFGIDSYLFIGF